MQVGIYVGRESDVHGQVKCRRVPKNNTRMGAKLGQDTWCARFLFKTQSSGQVTMHLIRRHPGQTTDGGWQVEGVFSSCSGRCLPEGPEQQVACELARREDGYGTCVPKATRMARDAWLGGADGYATATRLCVMACCTGQDLDERSFSGRCSCGADSRRRERE